MPEGFITLVDYSTSNALLLTWCCGAPPSTADAVVRLNTTFPIISPIKAAPPRPIPNPKDRPIFVSYFLQVELQPSPSFLFPSSHCSVAVLRIPSPHYKVQFAEQPSPDLLFPSSQVYPVSTTAFPQTVVVFWSNLTILLFCLNCSLL